ncbi:MAG: endonuclease [Candidatus Woesearchaeota archaeon]
MAESILRSLFEIYNLLLKNYKSQKWWPTTSENEIKPKYQYGPINEKQKLEVIFGSILTQNTSWKNVEKAIIELNKKDLINIDKIIQIDKKELALIIKSSGYYNQKAIKLKEMASFLKKNPISKLEKIEINELRKLLLSIKGVGKETADSIILYAFNKPIFVVDAYTKRIFSRIGLINKKIIDKKSSYDEIQDFFHKNLPKKEKIFNEYHALIVEHAKLFCKKKPLCENCILKDYCKKIL